jgi:AbrB family looped-hinge helix DNA binding protein
MEKSEVIAVHLIRVKAKYQITIPPPIRSVVDLSVGDFVEVSVQNGRIVLAPKLVIDRSAGERTAKTSARPRRRDR